MAVREALRPLPRRAWAVTVLALGLVLLPALPAAAHPLGNFTVNTADRLVLGASGVQVTHVVDLAEIPTVQLAQSRAGVDTDGDGDLSQPELDAYGVGVCRDAATTLRLQIDGRDAPLSVQGSQAQRRPGSAGLSTTRVECSMSADGRAERSVEFADPIAERRNGWKEISATSVCGRLDAPPVPEQSPSALLASYPEDQLASPLDVTTARLSVSPGGPCREATAAGVEAPTGDEVLPRGLDRLSSAFADFVGRADLTPLFGLVALAAAVAFGSAHALAPGHGKTVMAAYLVGQRGTPRQALQLGTIVTFTHTASVLLLGAVLALGALAAPEIVVPATEVVSGLLLAAVGVYLLVLGVRRLRAGHDHEHHDHEPHDHEPHDHEPEPHDHGHPFPAARSDGHGSVAVAPAPEVHRHGGRAHSHAALPEGPLSWRTLAAMGVAGGLVPSPSALLVLLGATSVGRAWFGVLLVLAYGVGMALTLTAAGLLLLRARAAFDRRGWTAGRGARLGRWIPLGTAGVVVLVGLALVVRGLGTGGGLL